MILLSWRDHCLVKFRYKVAQNHHSELNSGAVGSQDLSKNSSPRIQVALAREVGDLLHLGEDSMGLIGTVVWALQKTAFYMKQTNIYTGFRLQGGQHQTSDIYPECIPQNVLHFSLHPPNEGRWTLSETK